MRSLESDYPVAVQLRASRRRLAGVAVFSGVVNLLMFSGSLYMLQVYDRVIPSRNVATLLGLSAIVLVAYLLQGYFDALRSRMLADRRAVRPRIPAEFYLPLLRCPCGAQSQSWRSSRCAISIRCAHLSGADNRVSRHALDSTLSDSAFPLSPGIGAVATCGAGPSLR